MLISSDDGEEEKLKPSKFSVVLISSDDDDEEANEDLSLKIVQKAMLRACSTTRDAANIDESKGEMDLSSSPSVEADVVTDVKDDRKKERKKKKEKKNKKIETQDDNVDVVTEEEKAETCKLIVINESIETNPVEISDNVVLRKLLRGPRYFDPPDSGWGTCYNCGEEGHTTVNCASAKRRKPCFVCGSLEHNAKQCVKGKDCFICKKGGHRAKDCPEKYTSSQSVKICLKCGHSGHEMFSCKNDYSPDDLKEIQCYICKSFDHLCCVNYTSTGPREVSCYRCGQSGHTGLACQGLHGEPTDTGSLSSCYRCGEEGHFARECTSSAKGAKRKRELSTPKRRYPKENRDYMEPRSVPRDVGKARKNKKHQYEGGFTVPAKSKQKGGWITEDPGDFPWRKPKANGWRSPTTLPKRSNKIPNIAAGGNASNSHSSRKARKLHFGNSASNGSAKSYKHRFSASRFGSSSSDGMRNYDW